MGILSLALAGDFYVITGTFVDQKPAQEYAAGTGGWVLDTDVYSNSAPGRFAVVRGPFTNTKAAQAEMVSLRQSGSFKEIYVRDVGKLRLPLNLGSPDATPAILAALLGELAVEVTDHPGSMNPCEPQEPYQAITLSHVRLNRRWNAAAEKEVIEPIRQTIDLGGFWVLKSTGEIQRMRICAE